MKYLLFLTAMLNSRKNATMKISIIFLILSVFFAGCKGDDDKLTLNPDSIDLYSLDERLIKASSKATWSSDDEFIATVNNDGVVTGKHIGETFIRATSADGEGQCLVKVNARYNLYADPIFDFGASKSSIKSQEIRTIEGESNDAILYRPDKSSIENVMYMFEYGRMTGISVFVNTRNTSAEEVAGYLAERYLIVDTNSSETIIAIMLNNIPSRATMTSALAIKDNEVMIMYMAYDDNDTRSAKGVDMEKFKEMYDKSKAKFAEYK